MSRQFWQTTYKGVKLDKLRKTITLEAFCARAGETQSCLFFNTEQACFIGTDDIPSPSTFLNIGNHLTVEFWIKPLRTIPASNARIPLAHYYQATADGATYAFNILTDTDQIFARIQTTTGTFDVTGPRIAFNQWSHIALTFSSSDSQVKLYVNGELEATTATTGRLLTGASNRTYFGGYHNGDTLVPAYHGYLDEVRIYKKVKSGEDILSSMNVPRNPDETDLQAYFKFNEGSGSISYDTTGASGHDISLNDGQEWSVSSYPYKYGASKIVAEFEVETASRCSLKFPISLPEDSNFCLCVRWEDDEGIVQRRKLAGSDEADIAAPLEDYNGERLSEDFTFEVWNIDGNEDAEMEEDLEIETSLTSLPLTNKDTDKTTAVDDPSIIYAKGESFPLTFPLSFATIQWGSCASPVAQAVAESVPSVPVITDPAEVSTYRLTDESGNVLTDESGNPLTFQ